MRTKDFRRYENRLKDLRRRKLYRNHAINGRYELNLDKEDDSVSIINSIPQYGDSRYSEITVNPDLLDNKIGHWSEYPKTKYYGSKGYYRGRGWRCRAFKERILKEKSLDELVEEIAYKEESNDCQRVD